MNRSVLFIALAITISIRAFATDAPAGVISGPTDVCIPSTGIQYTVSGSSASTGYIWTLPTGGTITAGSGTKTITVSFSGSGNAGMNKTISVSGNGLSASYSVNLLLVPVNGTIQGLSTVCQGKSDILYAVSGFSNVNSFSWSVPSGNFSISSTSGGSTKATFPAAFTSGTLTLTPYNFGCAGTPVSKSITGVAPPSTPGTITGSTAVAAGTNGVSYSIASIPNATSYQWSVPSGVTITSGATTTSATVNFSSTFAGGYIYANGVNSVCSGVLSPPLGVNVPAPAGAISGNTSPCLGTTGVTVTYTVPTIANATSYEWTLSGGTVVGASNTNTININFPVDLPASPVSIAVRGINSLSAGASSSITVNPYKKPGDAGQISGLTAVCAGQSSVAYSVAPIENALTYIWSVSANSSIINGNNTNSILVSYASGYTGGTITVVALGGPCGGGMSSTLTISSPPLTPDPPGAISGSAIVCPGQTGVTYSVLPIANATSYTWTVPTGATIASNQGNQITVNYSSSVSGSVTVKGTNCSGNGTTSSLPITLRALPAAAGIISGTSTACLGELNVLYSVPEIANATSYVWTVPSGATIASGQGTSSIVVDYSPTSTSGNITVRGSNCIGLGTVSTKAISFPATTSGPVGGEQANYNVDLVTGTLRATVPLFNITHGDVSVPGELVYTASGVRVTDDDGWAGQNWSIPASSYGVFREMRSFPDDHSLDTRRGWLFGTASTTIKNFIPQTDNSAATCSDEVTNYTALNNINYNQDTEPDVFHVAAPGLSFDFYFDENRVPQVVPLADVAITVYTSAGVLTSSSTPAPIMSFVVTDQNGIQYTFAEVENTTENIYKTDKYYFVRKSNMHLSPFTYSTGWRLTKIMSPVFGTINLTYTGTTFSASGEEMTNDMKSYLAYVSSKFGSRFTALNYFYRYPLITSNIDNAGSNLAYQRSSTIKTLSSISSGTGQADFIYVAKKPGSQRLQLTNVRISDKRDGTTKVVRDIVFNYTKIGDRSQLSSIVKKLSCFDAKYSFQYVNNGFPAYDSKDKDEWSFYKIKDVGPGTLQYNETAPSMTLSRITSPGKGFVSFFYETNDFWNGTTTVQGGGIRIKSIINYDGVSTSNEGVQEFEYKLANGNSSGKLQHKSMQSIAVARHVMPGSQDGISYKEYQLRYPTKTIDQVNAAFTVQTEQDMSTAPTYLNGNIVAYERVTVKTVNGGKKIYEYDLPASYGETTANSGEWAASKVMIARASTGIAGTCYAIPNIDEGYNRYPFPPQPNYEFAKGLLKKVTDYNESGVKVGDKVYEYQRIYPIGETGIKKIYGLTLEELPTYYYNTSNVYVAGKMFVYSRYEIFTNVNIVQKKETATIYHTPDELVKSQSITTYNYTSPTHRMLSEIVTQNSDGTQSTKKLIYSNDLTPGSLASGTEAVALYNLANAHRSMLVETRTIRNFGGSDKTVAANLTTFQTISGKVYPNKTLSFVSADGSTTFGPTFINGSNVLQYDNSYVVDNSFLSFDAYGNATELKGRKRIVSGALYGFMGTLPVFEFSNANLSELMYHDFDDIIAANTTFNWTQTYTTGRNSPKALNLPIGSATGSRLVTSLTNNKTQNYILSFWAKATAAATLSTKITSGTSTTFTNAVPVSSEFKYYSFVIPVSSVIGANTTFTMDLWTNKALIIDELAFYPEQADFTITSYTIPNGVTAETDSRGNSVYYDKDVWGRTKAVYDRDKNVRLKYDYQTRP